MARGVLRRLVDEEGATVLAVSHDTRLNRAADRLIRLDRGVFVNVAGGSRSAPVG